MIFRFGRFELDAAASELRRDGVPVAVQPKPLALLLLLARERERVVPAGEILDALWPGVAVTPGSLTRAVSLARRAVGDAHRGEVIRSVSRRGYRFTADVMVLESARAAAPDGTRAPQAPFVGRDDAMAALQRRFDAALGGRGSFVLVTGPPGIGKTRLCEVFLEEVQRAGGQTFTGRSHDGEGVPAFWPWVQVLRRLTGAAGPALPWGTTGPPAELTDLLPRLGLESPAPPGSTLAPAQSRFLLFDAVSRALLRASDLRPTVVVLEDLQWAGHDSLGLLEHLLFELPEHPLVVLATLREEARPADHPVERALPRLRQHPACSEIVLRELSRGDVAVLLEDTLGRPAPTDLTSELFARTEGVPLFLREALRLLAERGDLERPEGVRRWGISLPSLALDLIRRPLARLSPAAGALVGAAAVLGREFVAGTAADVCGTGREAALDLLDEALRAGVIEPVDDAPGAFRFTHALFREAAYEGLAAGARALLHRRAAEVLEHAHGERLDPVIAELAHHHHAALAVGDPERAFTFAWRAGQRASHLHGHEQAALHYRQAVLALERCEPRDPVRQLECLLALGEAQRLAAQRDERRVTFARAMESARALARPVDFAKAAIGFCDLSEWAPRDDEARLALERALAELPPDATSVRARVQTRLGYLSARDAHQHAVTVLRDALALARQIGDPEVLQDANYALLFLLAGPDHMEERAALGAEVEKVVRTAEVTDSSVILFLDLACDRLVEGDAAGARARRALAEAVAGTQPHPGRLWHLRVYDTGLALLEGRAADAKRLLAETSGLGTRIGHPYARGVSRGLHATLARLRADEPGVLDVLDPVLPVRQGPVQWVQAFTGRALAAVARTAEARAFLDDLLAPGIARIPRNIRWYVTLSELAHLVADLADEAPAEELIALLGSRAHHHGVLPILLAYSGPFSFALGRLLALRGRLDAARDALEQAVESCEALGARPTQARVLLALGRVLERCGQRAASRDTLRECARIAAAFGMQSIEAAARDAG